MHEEFIKYLTDTCNCSSDSRFLLAVSGGVDSVVMTHLFHESGIDFSIAHCNFHLRGEESDGDQRFVEELAKQLSHPFYKKDFNTYSYADDQSISVQMAARNLRYAWFEEVRKEYQYDYISIAHNRNDVIETVLLNFARGTGIRGLTGIKPHNGNIIRPLLFAPRHDIMQFASEMQFAWREDSSNSQKKYIRNRIRHEIIPEFEIINPGFIQNASATIGRLEQTEQLLDHLLTTIRKEVTSALPDRYLINIEKLQEYPGMEVLLFELLREFGCNQLSIKSLVNSLVRSSGKQFLTRTHCITRDRSHLIVTKRTDPVIAEQNIGIDTAYLDFPVNLTFRTFKKTDDFSILVERHCAALDADLIKYPSKIRPWTAGDSFRPLGMNGSKKISDFLIDNKIPLPDKKNIYVFESGGEIAWLINYRIDDRFKITAKTRNVLLIEYRETNGDL
jgi:tRNA(Ile)-lysidine synthase